MKIKRRYMLLAIVVCLIAAEAAARLIHVTDFPLYRSDPVLGYLPLESQEGRFLRRNDWVFNNHSFGMRGPCPTGPNAILLLGDSVVMGGVWISQEQKLGSALSRLSGRPVCPLSAGSWALENELRAARQLTDLREFGAVVIISNSGDFGAASTWKSEQTHPTRKPLSALAHAIRKKLFPKSEVTDSVVSAASTRQWQRSLKAFVANYPGHIIWVIYPKIRELGHPSIAFSSARQILYHHATIINVGEDKRWSADSYEDGIHPKALAVRTLAEIITDGAKLDRHVATRSGSDEGEAERPSATGDAQHQVRQGGRVAGWQGGRVAGWQGGRVVIPETRWQSPDASIIDATPRGADRAGDRGWERE